MFWGVTQSTQKGSFNDTVVSYKIGNNMTVRRKVEPSSNPDYVIIIQNINNHYKKLNILNLFPQFAHSLCVRTRKYRGKDVK